MLSSDLRSMEKESIDVVVPASVWVILRFVLIFPPLQAVLEVENPREIVDLDDLRLSVIACSLLSCIFHRDSRATFIALRGNFELKFSSSTLSNVLTVK